MNDLATLLRDDVAASEPTTGLDARVPVRLGRRRLRTRRLVSGAAAAVVVGVGAAVGVPLVHDDSAGPSHGVDPSTQKGHDGYDAERMPRVLDDEVRSVLGRTVPDLGPASFIAGGEDGQLSAGHYDEALQMSVKYGDREHSWYVSLTYEASDAGGSLEQDCQQSPVDSLSCDVSTTPDGRETQLRLTALFPLKGDGGWRTATEAELVSGQPLWYQRSVKVVASEHVVVQAAEMVRATSRTAAEQAMLVPAGDLVEIGTDPALWIPEPTKAH